MFQCLNCQNDVQATRVTCRNCGLTYHGEFETPRLARLSPSDQDLVEAIVLSGGNLSRTAERMKMSYPTLRKRIDALADTLSDLRRADEARIDAMLQAVENGEIPAETAARRIREMGGGE